MKLSSARRPALTSIEAFLERLRADTAIGVKETLAAVPKVLIGVDDVLDRIHDPFAIKAWSENLAERGVLRARTAQQDLVILHAFAVDAQNADMADMVMAAGIDAARDLDLQFAQIVLAFEIGKALGNLRRDRNRAGIGQVAIIQARAGDDVGDQPIIRRRQIEGGKSLP